jgi:hypothetical protein|tara:strand:+ start:137 stop:448 length:312 start_codon:yes stop_codon:yes gene_type:complete
MHNTEVVTLYSGGAHVKVSSLEDCLDSCLSSVCNFEGTDCLLKHSEVSGFAFHPGMDGIVCAGARVPEIPDRTAHAYVLIAVVSLAILVRSAKLLKKPEKVNN